MHFRSIATVLFIQLNWSVANAGPLAVGEVPTPNGLASYVLIDKDIELGDSTRFLRLLQKTPDISGVMLHSTGGSLDDGLAIAKVIYERKLDTMVPESCHSVCAIMFLAGNTRFISATAALTFHSAYRQLGDWVVVDNRANGTVAWFLGHMGYPLALARLWMDTPTTEAAPITVEMNASLQLGFTVLAEGD